MIRFGVAIYHDKCEIDKLGAIVKEIVGYMIVKWNKRLVNISTSNKLFTCKCIKAYETLPLI